MSEAFQIKLYRLVTEGRSGITWSNVGDSIYIDVPKFRKFLSRANSFCKSKNVTSFIRQLNLYGFKIVIDLDEDDKHAHNKNLKEYSNTYFLRGRPDLLSKITRNGRDIKLKLPTSTVPPLPTQAWGKRKRQISKQDQYNPSAKKIKQEVIDETYQPFEYAGSTIEQIDPYSKKIKQEIIDTSYEGIQSNSLTRAESHNEELNPVYNEIATTMPLYHSTRNLIDKELVSILKPPIASTSEMTEDKNIVRNGSRRRYKKNFTKKVLEAWKTEINENSSVIINSAEPENAASAGPPIQNFDNSGVGNYSGEPQNAQSVPPVKITQNTSVAFNSVESQSAKPTPPIQITQNSGVAFNSVESQSAKPAPPIQITQNSGVAFNFVESQSEKPAPPIQITQNSGVAFNSAESQSAKPAPPIQLAQNSCVAYNSVESQSAKPCETPPIQMVVEHKNETNILSDIDVITLLTEEKFHQMEMECLTQIKESNVSTNTAISEVFHGEDLHVIEEIVVLNPQEEIVALNPQEEIVALNPQGEIVALNPQDGSESIVDVMENQDHQYARNYIEEITPNMVNQANDDEGDVFDLLPWRRRPPSSYMFSNVLLPYKSDHGCPCPRLINCRALKVLKEDTTEPILKSGSENLLWSSSLYKNREAFRKAILHEFFRIVYDKSYIVSNGRGELKPKSIQEVLEYKIKK